MFESGDVLRVDWEEHLIRVLMADAHEVFYDVFLPEGIGWGLARARTATYLRIPVTMLASSASIVGAEPLSEKEFSRHRPDLPLRLLRNDRLSWCDDKMDFDAAAKVRLEVGELALLPFGPKGASLKAKKVTNSKNYFSGTELLAFARSIQNVNCPEVAGVGFYRSGISGSVPSFYLWGAIDRAGNVA